MATNLIPEDVPRLRNSEHIIAVSGEVGAGMFPKALMLPNGEIIGVVRDGAPHIGIGGRLDLIRSTNGGHRWSKPATMFRTSQDDRGPSIGQAADGTLICMYRIYDAYERQGNRKKDDINQYTMLSLSHDSGETWSKPVEVKLTPFDFVAPFQRMVCLSDGTILMPAYAPLREERDGHQPGTWALVIRSQDNGRTWGDITYIAPQFNEYALLSLPDGRLLVAMRNEKQGLWTSYSSDQGYTWSEPKQVTEGRRLPADLLMLSSGKILLLYGRRHPPYGVECRLSGDLGETWSPPVALTWTATNADCGYPSGVVTDKGTIMVLWYTVGSTVAPDLGFHCEAVRFREEDILKSMRD